MSMAVPIATMMRSCFPTFLRREICPSRTMLPVYSSFELDKLQELPSSSPHPIATAESLFFKRTSKYHFPFLIGQDGQPTVVPAVSQSIVNPSLPHEIVIG